MISSSFQGLNNILPVNIQINRIAVLINGVKVMRYIASVYGDDNAYYCRNRLPVRILALKQRNDIVFTAFAIIEFAVIAVFVVKTVRLYPIMLMRHRRRSCSRLGCTCCRGLGSRGICRFFSW